MPPSAYLFDAILVHGDGVTIVFKFLRTHLGTRVSLGHVLNRHLEGVNLVESALHEGLQGLRKWACYIGRKRLT